MVILGGLELVAAGYIIHKHAQNKKEKARIQGEAAALEESQYRLFPEERHSSSQHRRRTSRSRSRSRRRHSHDGGGTSEDRRKVDGKYKHEGPSPTMAATQPQIRPGRTMSSTPAQPMQATLQARPPVHVQPQMAGPPPYSPGPQLMPQAGDVKYGWTDDHPAPAPQAPQQDLDFPPTGWPAHWEQSQTPQDRRSRPESSRGRQERRREETSRVRFALPKENGNVRSPSRSPPPSYRY